MNPEHLSAIEGIDLADSIDVLAKVASSTYGPLGDRVDRILAAARLLQQDIDDLAADERHSL